jgi:hypothetical protein
MMFKWLDIMKQACAPGFIKYRGLIVVVCKKAWHINTSFHELRKVIKDIQKKLVEAMCYKPEGCRFNF